MSQTTITTLEGTTTLPDETVEEFRERLRGPLLFPDDPGFEEATRLWNGMIDKAPALVVQPTGTADVAASVDFARRYDVRLSVKGGGHNIAGTALADGGLTIDMSRLNGVIVDPDKRTVTAEAGCLLGDVDRETQLHGLATPLGFVSETGLAGLTLGGGFGYLTRRYGWTVDNLREVEIVTADGEVRRASQDENTDLFWAVRGAGHNFGVVTRFTYELHEVGPTVYGGLIAWPHEQADTVLETYRELTANAPRELTAFLIMRRAPPAPFVPEEWHGERICAMPVCYTGDPDNADDALQRIRELPDPVFDMLQEQPYTELQSYLDATQPKGNHYYWKTEFTSELSTKLLSTMRDLAGDCPIPAAQLVIAHIGGKLNEYSADHGAVGNRDARYVYGAAGMWEPSESREEEYREWVRDAWRQFQPYSTGGNYVNFQTKDTSQERVRATYGDNYPRLVEIKRKYDPNNLFRSNQNITPTR